MEKTGLFYQVFHLVERLADRGKAQKYLTSAAAKAQEFRTDITKYTLPVLISPVA